MLDAIAGEIEAIVPVDTQSSVDMFARVTGRQSDDALTGRRLFALRWSDPLPMTPADQSISCARLEAGVELLIGYADTAAGHGRLGDDAKSITNALLGLPRSVSAANVTGVEVASSADSGTLDGAVVATYSTRFEFDGS